MFAIKNTFLWPVDFSVPVDGKPKKVRVTIEYHRVPQERVDELIEKKVKDDDVVQEVVAGWGPDVTDDEGNPLDFNPASFKQLLSVVGARGAIVQTFLKAIHGEAAAKN